MKAYHPTPEFVVDQMVDRLFSGGAPKRTSRVLDPGCADGAFIAGIIRWCKNNSAPIPHILGVERNPSLCAKARKAFREYPQVEILCADYLNRDRGNQLFSHIICNPPYYSMVGLSPQERQRYRSEFRTATGRFDLYMLFFERAMEQLEPDGRAVFVTPEKYLYVESAAALRTLLAERQVEEITLLREDSFEGLVTYPAITVIVNSSQTSGDKLTAVITREGNCKAICVPRDGKAWWPYIQGQTDTYSGPTLRDYSIRVSAGVATGADSVFLIKKLELPRYLYPFALPALAGRDLELANGDLPPPRRYLLSPYDNTGRLLDESELGRLRSYFREGGNREKLIARTCARRKPWYAFHDSFPLDQMLKPKIICKDIASRPRFWIERDGIVPLHSVYYIVPKKDVDIAKLCAWLNGPETAQWLQGNCQRAANGFCRIQSHVLKCTPIPVDISQRRNAPRTN